MFSQKIIIIDIYLGSKYASVGCRFKKKQILKTLDALNEKNQNMLSYPEIRWVKGGQYKSLKYSVILTVIRQIF